MWIRRDDYTGLMTRNASLAATVQQLIAQLKRAEKGMEFWQGQFEASQRRADRIADKEWEIHGQPPVSDLGVSEVQKKESQKQANLEQMTADQREIFGPMFIDGEELPEPGKVIIDPSIVAAITSALPKKA